MQHFEGSNTTSILYILQLVLEAESVIAVKSICVCIAELASLASLASLATYVPTYHKSPAGFASRVDRGGGRIYQYTWDCFCLSNILKSELY